ncbi:class I SAM-dependent methyltransferase [Alteromonas pelagimontana]|uniref:Class I SAM-dependent methyltransferase n=1 Tax=Alteromonas pelagimontana TaxID=1858656 RepID=A0A6M4MFG3_9ALTE|nr:class I SAM-dependent methyltransferase [Alteromonas pelagimontana]QJR81839.1 class I SAM-dependent methyltransferase [Alteromonas pelagimontana]
MKAGKITRCAGEFQVTVNEAAPPAQYYVWEKFTADESLDELKVTVLPYLTSMEADLAMLNWFDMLIIGGRIRLETPDMDFAARQWLQAEWSDDNIKTAESPARKAFAAIWGEQQNGNPRNKNYCEMGQNIYKSGYNARRMELLLIRAGFCETEIICGDGVLTAIAHKTMRRGERQIANSYDMIREDHRNRYLFASEFLGADPGMEILDLACGIGYGTLLLSEKVGAAVIGVDIDKGAIAQARRYFNGENTAYLNVDARYADFAENSFDAIVSFETIEHVEFDELLAANFYYWLKPGGQLICSTPNEDVMPFDKQRFKFHVKHYTNSELTDLLENAGFSITAMFTQRDDVAAQVEEGDDGCFTIAVAEKR